MTKLRFQVELDYDADIIHGDDADSKKWFFEEILGGQGLTMMEVDLIGDEVGSLRIIGPIEEVDG